jgi:hypothetical protein
MKTMFSYVPIHLHQTSSMKSIHTAQFKNGRLTKSYSLYGQTLGDDVLEFEVQRKLVKNAPAYGITEVEVAAIKDRALRIYKRLQGSGNGSVRNMMTRFDKEQLMIYLVKKATIVRDSGLVRVLPIEDGTSDKLTQLHVIESPTKCLTFRASRRIFDEAGHDTSEFIFIVEKPNFDIKSIIGMHLSSVQEPR